MMNIISALLSLFFTLTPQGTDTMIDTTTPTGSMPVIHHATLKNGLKIIAVPRHDVPQVALTMFVNVGAKHEGPGQKGLAHLLEHMIFKGTQDADKNIDSDSPRNDVYSESDINTIAFACGAQCNAFTSSDYTCYYFCAPRTNWKPLLSILANSLTKCSLKEDHLASEFKAVIQELKMGRDRHTGVLFHQLCQSIFAGHPYHYPVIGYKEDIWNVHSQDLKAFYKEHYRPDNAILVVVGDLEPSTLAQYAADVFESSVDTLTTPEFAQEKNKDQINPQALEPELALPQRSSTKAQNNTSETNYFHDTLSTKHVTLFRDVAQAQVLHLFCFKNTLENDYLASLVTSMLQSSAEGSLSNLLCDELQLTTSLQTQLIPRSEYLTLMMIYQPKSTDDIEKIDGLIQNYIDSLSTKIDQDLLNAALIEHKSSLMSVLNQNLSLALELGKATLTYGNPEAVFAYQDATITQELEKQLQSFCDTHLTRSRRHTGHLLALSSKDAARWREIQQEEDKTDAALLAQRVRTTKIEDPIAAHNLKLEEPAPFSFPKPEVTHLKNGLTVLSCNRPAHARTACILRLPFMVDPAGKEGIGSLLNSLLDEGTTNYSRQELYRTTEKHGIDLEIGSGTITLSCFKQDLPLCLELLNELVSQALFKPEALSKVKTNLHKARERQQKTSSYKAGVLFKNHCYPDHPLSKPSLGTYESLEAITQQDLELFYRQNFRPEQSTLAIVGDISEIDLAKNLEDTLASWKANGEPCNALPEYPSYLPAHLQDVSLDDQVTLWFFGPSISCKHPDYQKLLIFDQIFGPGELGSMNHRLFDLREATGIFYGVGGSVISGATAHPGKPGHVIVQTRVSKDRLEEAVSLFGDLFGTVAESITKEDVQKAKHVLAYATINYYATNQSTAHTFLFLDKHKLPFDYYDTCYERVKNITRDEIVEAVKPLLARDKMSIITVGRL